MEWPWFLRWRSLRTLARGGSTYFFGKRGKRRVTSYRLYYRMRLLVPLFSHHAAKGMARLPRARLWADSEVFPRIFTLLRRARHTVVIQMFLWKDDHIGRTLAATLVEIADRGVAVFIHKEAVGDVFELERDFLSTKRLRSEPWQRFWRHPRIRIEHGTHHDHAKVFIIDDRTVLVTGMNAADEYHESWHDYMVELRGAGHAERLLSPDASADVSLPIGIVVNTENRKELRGVVMHLLESARQSIVLEQCYFSDPAVVDLLIRRSREGVRVTLILPSQIDVHYHSNITAATRLLAEGSPHHVRVFIYDGIFHAKVILVDRFRAFLGSANLITESLDSMGEANVLINSRVSGAVLRLRDILRRDVLRSRPFRGPPAFLWYHRFLAWLRL